MDHPLDLFAKVLHESSVHGWWIAAFLEEMRNIRASRILNQVNLANSLPILKTSCFSLMCAPLPLEEENKISTQTALALPTSQVDSAQNNLSETDATHGWTTTLRNSIQLDVVAHVHVSPAQRSNSRQRSEMTSRTRGEFQSWICEGCSWRHEGNQLNCKGRGSDVTDERGNIHLVAPE